MTSGPRLKPAAVARIRSYAGAPPSFATVTELEAYFREIYASFGVLSDAQWRQLTETSLRRLPDGRVTPHYDRASSSSSSDRPTTTRFGTRGTD